MTKTILSVLFLTSILMTAAIAASMDLFESADATQSQGSFHHSSSKKVCGDQLCSKTGGKILGLKPSNVTVPATEIVTPPTIEPTPPTTEVTPPTPEPTVPITEEPMDMGAHQWMSTTATITSVKDPGIGHETHQLAIILPPSNQTYSGILTYSASEEVQLVALHGPLAEGEDVGQATWSPDGKTKFALTFIEPKTSMGSWEFSGNALAVHTKKTTPFTVSYSVVAEQ
jgi:hypothetical protein